MFRITLISLLLSFACYSITDAQQSEINSGFEWVPLQEAQILAEASGKKILLFGYAEWCTYCLKMRKESFTDERVQESLSEYYIPVQLNGESEELIEYNGQKMQAKELARYLRLSTYPTHFFIDSDGSIIAGQKGFIEPDIYSLMLEYVATGAMEKMGFEEFVTKRENEG